MSKRYGVCAPKGFKASGVAAGIKDGETRDVALVYSEKPASAAAVFTTNLVKAAPVLISQDRIKNRKAQAIVFSSGNANAATGEDGLAVAQMMTEHVANKFEIPAEEVLIAQTELIGIPLDPDVAGQGVLTAIDALSENGGKEAAEGIMTTDTYPKYASTKFQLDGKEVTVGIIAKGVAMLAPSMATMLAALTTDADVSADVLDQILRLAVQNSFHSVVVDGCQSTNDTVFALANGASGAPSISSTNSEGYKELLAAISNLCLQMAKEMAQDAEGGAKFITIRVTGAANDSDARKATLKVAGSILVKCAVAGECAYWGRVISELGASGAQFDPNKVSISFGGVENCKNGVALSHDETAIQNHMQGADIFIEADLGAGDCEAFAYGSDLTHEYLDINMEKS